MIEIFAGSLVIIAPILLVYNIFKFRIPKGLTMFIGVPGAGKTTICARLKVLHDKSLRKKKHKWGNKCYCNVPILGALKISAKDFGNALIDDGILLFDESGIELSNRSWKSLSHKTLEFAKLYRHYGIKSFCMFSQGMDTDIVFLRLADRIGVVTKSILPYFIQVRYAVKYVGIDEVTHQLVDQYRWRLLGRKFVFAPTCWKMFDTYEKPDLPKMTFPVFNTVTRLEEEKKEEEKKKKEEKEKN